MAARRRSGPAALPATGFPRHLQRNDPPAVVVLAGGEAWFREMCRASLLAKVLPDGDPGGALTRLDAKASEDAAAAAGVLDALRTPSLFGGQRVLVVRHAESLPKPEGSGRSAALTAIVQRALTSPPRDALLVLETSRGAKGKGSVSTAALMEAGAWVVDCRALYDAPGPWERGTPPWDHELSRFLVSRARRAWKRTLAVEDAHALVQRVGNDLAALDGALQQLSLASPGDAITATQIDEQLGESREDPIWALADAVLDGRREEAWRMLQAAFDRGLHDARGAHVHRPEALAPMLLGILTSSWWKRLAGSDALAQGESAAVAARAAGVPPFLADGFARGCRRRSPAGWLALSEPLLEAERGLKGGGVPARLAMERLVARVVASAETSVG